MLSSIVPLVENKADDIRSKDNYRPVAINSVISKLFEIVIHNRYSHFLLTRDNQFSFKAKSSTDMCIFTFKQVIEHHKNLSSSVYVCFLDASKAFDRINHWHLLKKLTERNIPLFVIRILMYWFNEQSFCVKWGNKASCFFKVSNGLRQGGILSPLFFNVYLDKLSISLSSSSVGCKLVDKSFNHLMYADDMTVLAPSVKGLQNLINICASYAEEHEIVFNSSKTVCLCISAKSYKPKHLPTVYLNNAHLKYVSSFKYLGFVIIEEFNDSTDVKKQIRSLYARANMLLAKFSHCTSSVKAILFQSYCANMYCSHLWWNYGREIYKRIEVAYNNCFRKLMGSKICTSASKMFLDNRVHHFSVLRRKSLCKFMNHLRLSDNSLVYAIYNANIMYCSSFYKEFCQRLFK